MTSAWTDDDTRAVMDRLYAQAQAVSDRSVGRAVVIVAAALDERLRRKDPGAHAAAQEESHADPVDAAP